MNVAFYNQKTRKFRIENMPCVPNLGDRIHLFNNKESFGTVQELVWFPCEEYLDDVVGGSFPPMLKVDVLVVVF